MFVLFVLYFIDLNDIVLKDENKLLGVEVKYKNKISKQDFASLYHFKEGIIASRSTFNPGDTYSIIPVHILLGIIEQNPR